MCSKWIFIELKKNKGEKYKDKLIKQVSYSQHRKIEKKTICYAKTYN